MGPAVTAGPRFPDPAGSKRKRARPDVAPGVSPGGTGRWLAACPGACLLCSLPPTRCGGSEHAPSGDGGFSDSGDKDDDDDDDADEKMQSSGIPNGGHIRQESQEQSEVDHGDFEMVVSLAAGGEEEPRHTPPALVRELPQAPVTTGH